MTAGAQPDPGAGRRGGETADGPRGWVLYDAACGFCARWVPFWRRVLAAHRIGIAPLQSAWARTRLPSGALLDDLRVVESGGRMHTGADAYRFAFRRIPAATLFDLLARLPLVAVVFNAAYRVVARNRYRISGACRIPSPAALSRQGRGAAQTGS